MTSQVDHCHHRDAGVLRARADKWLTAARLPLAKEHDQLAANPLNKAIAGNLSTMPWILRTRILTPLVLGLGLAVAAMPATAFVATIGSDADCDYRIGVVANPLETAALAGATDIRLQVGDLGDRSSLINNRSFGVRGGYASCAAAQSGADPVGRTRLRVNSDDDGRPLTLIAMSSRHVVTLENLVFEDDRSGTPILTGWGGAITAIGQIDLSIANSEFRNLRVSVGGGAISTLYEVRVSLSATRLVGNTSRISGGGIHCEAGGEIVIGPDSLLSNNAALGLDDTGGGGAVFADDCDVVVLARAHPDAAPDAVHGLIDNRAHESGGAIHALDSTLSLLGGPHCRDGFDCSPWPVLVRGNQAGADDNPYGEGGAIYVENSTVEMDHFVLQNNHADDGGAIATRDGRLHASLLRLGLLASDHYTYGGPDGHDCWDASRCNWITGNTASWGGGVWRLDYAVLHGNRLRIEGNSAQLGALVHSIDHNQILLMSSVITGNSDIAPARGTAPSSAAAWRGGASERPGSGRASPRGEPVSTLFWLERSALALYSSTLADNAVSHSLVAADHANANVQLYSNILHQPGLATVVSHPSDVFSAQCNLANVALPQTGNVISDDPRFHDSTQGDYRLRADSLARDVCPIAHGSQFDIETHAHRIESATVPPRFDAGAYRYRSDDSGRTIVRGGSSLTITDGAYDGTLSSMDCQSLTATTLPAGARVQDLSLVMAIDHPLLGDLTAKLISPQGTVLAVLERPRGDDQNPPGDVGASPPYGDESGLSARYPLRFHDAYFHDPETLGAGIDNDHNGCEHQQRCEFTANPDEAFLAGNSVIRFADFAGEPAAGPWQLCLADSSFLPDSGPGALQSWFLVIDYIVAPDDDRLFADGFEM